VTHVLSLTLIDLSLILALLSLEIESGDSYFNRLAPLYASFFQTQRALARLENGSGEFIDAQEVEWKRRLGKWKSMRVELEQLRMKLHEHVTEARRA
jgi:hypothetical protein